MSKEELYRDLKSDLPLSRKKLNEKLSGREDTNLSEFDEFERDAIEGWESTGQKSIQMKRLDKRFMHSYRSWYVGIGIGCVLILSLYFLNNANESNLIQAKENETLEKTLIEETDLYIVEKIDSLIENKSDNQIAINLLQGEQNKKPTVTKLTRIEEPILIDKLPLLQVHSDLSNKNKPLVLSNKRMVKEIYLWDFKLVDYRTIRSKGKIETKQLDLTGTSANKESKELGEDEPVWRNVDIPYYDYIDKSMYLMNRNEIKKALARFEVILNTYPDDVNAQFYCGFAYFNLENFSKSKTYLLSVLDNEIANFNEEAIWYLGLCFEKNGEKMKAKEIFESIANSKSHYVEQATKKLQ